jgi:hypothetical protein
VTTLLGLSLGATLKYCVGMIVLGILFFVGADVTEGKDEGIMLGPELGSGPETVLVLGTLLIELEGT